MAAVPAFEIPLLDLSLVAAADYSAKQFYAMRNTTTGGMTLAATAGQRCIGILQDDPTSGKVGSVRVLGVSKALAGGTIAVDDPLTCDAAGKLVAATKISDHVFARALSSASSGDIFPVLLGGAFTASPGMQGQTWSFPITLASISGAGDVLTNYTPGYAGTITAIDFAVSVVASTSSKLASLNMEIGTTDLTGGVVALTTATVTPLGKVIAGSAVTALNIFAATDNVSVEASSVTAFAEGAGYLLVRVQ